MRSVCFAFAFSLLVAASTAAPANPNALEPVIDDKPAEENPAELMLELMKAMMAMQKQQGGEDNGSLETLEGFMGQAADLMKELQSGDMNDPDHLQSTLLAAGMKAASGIEGLDVGKILGIVGEFGSGDPANAVLGLMDMAMHHSGLGLDEEDPLMKLAKSGARTLINGEVAADDNPFQHLHDVVAPTVGANKDNALMQLILQSILAAANDKTGDPFNAVVEYVMEHPTALSNPIVSNAKLVHDTITKEDLHHTSKLVTTAKEIMETLAHPDLHEQSELVQLISSVVEDPSKLAEDSPLVKVATDVHKTLLNASPEEQQGHLMEVVKSFTTKVISGEQAGIEDIMAAHPAGQMLADAAEMMQTIVDDPTGSDDALVKHGIKVLDAVVNPSESSTDPIVQTIKTVHDNINTIDETDPLVKAATAIHQHVTEGLDEVGIDLSQFE